MISNLVNNEVSTNEVSTTHPRTPQHNTPFPVAPARTTLNHPVFVLIPQQQHNQALRNRALRIGEKATYVPLKLSPTPEENNTTAGGRSELKDDSRSVLSFGALWSKFGG